MGIIVGYGWLIGLFIGVYAQSSVFNLVCGVMLMDIWPVTK
jgi:hypothetical protein